jgi:outer membrane protein TolC
MMGRALFAIPLALLIGGCVLAPKEADDEQKKLDAAAGHYASPVEKRTLAELPAEPTWRDVLQRAFLANGDLEAAYHEWAMAVARINIAGTYPSAPVSLGFEYMFSADNMKAWDRTTVTGTFDNGSGGLPLPNKVKQDATIATRDAQAAGERFAAAKFKLQRQVLRAWIDYALMAEQVRVQEENNALLKLLNDTAAARLQAGGMQQDLLRTDIELRMAQDELATMQSKLPQMRAMLNGMLGRPPEAPLPAPTTMPAARSVPVDDASLFAVGVSANPELRALAHDSRGRSDAIERARMEYLPDINPMAGFTGGVAQFIGADLMIPTAIPKIRAMVTESRANLARVQAMQRQTTADRRAEYVAAVYALRNAERQTALFEKTILPAAQRVLDSARQQYTAGTAGYLDLIEAQRTLLDVRLTIAEARAARERSLTDLEALAGVDFETVKPSSTQPQVKP